MRNPWMKAGLQAWALGFESAAVVGLRTMKIAQGGAAGSAEAQRMVSEKLEAVARLQALAMTGALGATAPAATAKALTHLRRTVRANQRRLSRK